MNPQAVSHTHSNWKAGEARRAAEFQNIDTRLDNVRACIRWLVAQGVFIDGVDMRIKCAGAPIVHVVASPLLHILFKDDCASGGQDRPPGSRFTYIPWKARRFECEIHWSEVKQ